MRKLEKKEIVLLALYGEYLKEPGDFRLILPGVVDMSEDVFNWAVMCLQTEGLVDGVTWIPKGSMQPDRLLAICYDGIHLTGEGVRYAEAQLAIQQKARTEKIIAVAGAFGSLSLDVLKSLLIKQLGG